MSISLAGVVGIDGLLKRELPAVEGDSDWEGERNLALLRGGMGAVKGKATGGERDGEGTKSRRRVTLISWEQQVQTSATVVLAESTASFERDANDGRPQVQRQCPNRNK